MVAPLHEEAEEVDDPSYEPWAFGQVILHLIFSKQKDLYLLVANEGECCRAEYADACPLEEFRSKSERCHEAGRDERVSFR